MTHRSSAPAVAGVLMLLAVTAHAQSEIISTSASARDCETAYVEALRRLIQRHGAVLVEVLARDETRVAKDRERTEFAVETETLVGGLFRTRFVRTEAGESGCTAEITVTQEELARSQDGWLELLETRRGQERVLQELSKLQGDVGALKAALHSQDSIPDSAWAETPDPESPLWTSTPDSPDRTARFAHLPRILFIRVDAAMETYGDPFTVMSSLPVFGQSGSLTSSYTFQPPKSIDGTQLGATLRVWEHFAIGVTRTRTTGSFSSAVNASIPPAQDGSRARSAGADFMDLRRTQDILHIELTATAGDDDFEVAVYVGPSLMKVSQELMTGVTLTNTPGSVTITSGQSREVEDRRTIGFNVGADATWFFLKYFGLGAGVRYSRGLAIVALQGRPVEVVLGASQISMGVRLRL